MEEREREAANVASASSSRPIEWMLADVEVVVRTKFNLWLSHSNGAQMRRTEPDTR